MPLRTTSVRSVAPRVRTALIRFRTRMTTASNLPPTGVPRGVPAMPPRRGREALEQDADIGLLLVGGEAGVGGHMDRLPSHGRPPFNWRCLHGERGQRRPPSPRHRTTSG